jgi:prolipoprotein diacylglyceryl transferase
VHVQPVAMIPSPTRSVWHLGPVPIRAYALCIVAGIVVALWLTIRRWRERGGAEEDVWDIGGWAIVFGIVGGRLYHVMTDPELYFDSGRHPLDALKVWDGGLGIWGAIALGGVGAWIGCRRKAVSFVVFADAAAPGIALAQGIGRWGNWFNNELYGGPTSLPWGLQVHCMDIIAGHAVSPGVADGGQVCQAGGATVAGLFQPTFLYESLWDVLVAIVVIYADRRFRLGRGNAFAGYVMGYTLGRVWIEALRHDPAHHVLGLRLNIWTSIIVFALALTWFVRHGGLAAEREASPVLADGDAGPAEEDVDDDVDVAELDGDVSAAGSDVEVGKGSDD